LAAARLVNSTVLAQWRSPLALTYCRPGRLAQRVFAFFVKEQAVDEQSGGETGRETGADRVPVEHLEVVDLDLPAASGAGGCLPLNVNLGLWATSLNRNTWKQRRNR
jgi:hypothetical protein